MARAVGYETLLSGGTRFHIRAIPENQVARIEQMAKDAGTWIGTPGDPARYYRPAALEAAVVGPIDSSKMTEPQKVAVHARICAMTDGI